MLQDRLLFLTLNTFSSTGGIEQVCRVAGKAFQDLTDASGEDFVLYALNDSPGDVQTRYVRVGSFKGFSGNKSAFILAAVQAGRKAKKVVLSHINLLPIAAAIKLFSPSTQIALYAHGIEVWRPLPVWKVSTLKKLDAIWAVSEFTCRQMIERYRLNPANIQVLNNCLDPFLKKTGNTAAAARRKAALGLRPTDQVLFTLTRLRSTEQYKGYDKVMECLPAIVQVLPDLKYVIAGKYDAAEKLRLDVLIKKLGLEGRVVFAGYVPEEEVEEYFNLADVYVMPSKGEGFGIVFIEALFYGKPVIAGNQDGSVDALDRGRMGLLVNPASKEELTQALLTMLHNPQGYVQPEAIVQARFGFENYKQHLRTLIRFTKGAGATA